jgi:hypothetical protein
MVGLIRDTDTIDGWFLFDNSAENASQEFLLKNQTIYKQISHIHGDLGEQRHPLCCSFESIRFFTGADIAFGLRTKFDENDPSVKRLEVITNSRRSSDWTRVHFFTTVLSRWLTDECQRLSINRSRG